MPEDEKTVSTSADNSVVELDMERLRKVLFDAAKLRWGTGVVLGHMAAVVVPAALWFDYSRWTGLTVAAAMSVLGTLLRWYSESVRGNADRLHRAYELSSTGQPIDPALTSDLMAAYPRLIGRIRRMKNDGPYYDAKGDPSIQLLVSRLRESAWWTDKLAATAKRLSYYFGCIVAITILVSFVVVADSVEVRAYAMVICAIVVVDIFHLGWRYGNLSAACARAYSRLDALHGKAGLTEREAITEANGYQSARDAGPLIPGWIWKLSRKKLNAAWRPLSRPFISERR